MKHNNAIHKLHFHKDWQRYVRTWFNQPARKQRRRAARQAKAKAIAPRPVENLRPVVRCPTIKYNSRVRVGRGFTLDELKAAGVNRRQALGLGICVDVRRKNRNEEAFQANVDRLKAYVSKMVLFPLNPSSKRAKKGDATRAQCKDVAEQQTDIDVAFPIKTPAARLRARVITEEEKSVFQTAVARKALTDGKLWGLREKRAKDAAEAAAAKGKGKKKKKGKK